MSVQTIDDHVVKKLRIKSIFNGEKKVPKGASKTIQSTSIGRGNKFVTRPKSEKMVKNSAPKKDASDTTVEESSADESKIPPAVHKKPDK